MEMTQELFCDNPVQSKHFWRSAVFAFLGIIVVLLNGCAHHFAVSKEAPLSAYIVSSPASNRAIRWAPVFITHGYSEEFNRIGRPSARSDTSGNTTVYVDPEQPVVYYKERQFRTDKATYTNLIYRVHFSKVPFSLIPFHLTAGKNVGLLVIVTLNAAARPVLVTTVHTCGCYKAIVPTDYLPDDALPDGWTGKPIPAYGERLPAMLVYSKAPSARLVVHLRPGVHRIMDLEVAPARELSAPRYRMIPMPMEAMEALNHLSVDDAGASFFHQSGIMRGHVKGSIKPLELIFLGLPSLDLFVGSDKMYADPAVSGNYFYTDIKPWRQKESDMWDFAGFLNYWGWRL